MVIDSRFATRTAIKVRTEFYQENEVKSCPLSVKRMEECWTRLANPTRLTSRFTWIAMQSEDCKSTDLHSETTLHCLVAVWLLGGCLLVTLYLPIASDSSDALKVPVNGRHSNSDERNPDVPGELLKEIRSKRWEGTFERGPLKFIESDRLKGVNWKSSKGVQQRRFIRDSLEKFHKNRHERVHQKRFAIDWTPAECSQGNKFRIPRWEFAVWHQAITWTLGP